MRGDHLLVGRAVEHLAIVAVADAQHLGPVGIVAAALAPQLGRLQRRHQHFLRAGAVLLLAHDLLDLLEHAKAERQPGINPRRRLPDQSRAEHQLVADDLGVRRAFLEDGEKGSGPAHGAGALRAHVIGWQPTGTAACGCADTGRRKSNPRQFAAVTAVRRRAYSIARPNALALGSGSGPRQATGDARRDTSKGADEQSSRRAPGSLVDPGVCVCRPASTLSDPVDGITHRHASASNAPVCFGQRYAP